MLPDTLPREDISQRTALEIVADPSRTSSLAHSEAAEAQRASETAELTEVRRAAEASTIVAGGKVLPSQRVDELCECCEIENRLPRQLNVSMKCRQNVFAKAMDELRENLEMCRSPTSKHMQEDAFATSERPPRASRMMRRGDETPTEGGETLAVRPQRGRQIARQSSEAQLATVAPLLRWLMSHPAAWAMGRMAARAARASSEQTEPTEGMDSRTSGEQTEPTEGMDSRTMRRAAVALSR